MFQAKTVFILGAGASCHYGYPTGEQLVRRVQKKADQVSRFLEEAANNPRALSFIPDYVKYRSVELMADDITGLRNQLRDASKNCLDLVNRLQYVAPLVIDYFIGQNRHLEHIAKLCIAWEILEREAAEDLARRKPNNSGIDVNTKNEN